MDHFPTSMCSLCLVYIERAFTDFAKSIQAQARSVDASTSSASVDRGSLEALERQREKLAELQALRQQQQQLLQHETSTDWGAVDPPQVRERAFSC